jgi:hypothetical protein
MKVLLLGRMLVVMLLVCVIGCSHLGSSKIERGLDGVVKNGTIEFRTWVSESSFC